MRTTHVEVVGIHRCESVANVDVLMWRALVSRRAGVPQRKQRTKNWLAGAGFVNGYNAHWMTLRPPFWLWGRRISA